MGPVPNRNRAAAVMSVVTWESTMVTKALSYPASIADRTVLPSFNSSRMRSKMRTLLSTAIPMPRAIPAMPGSVSVARIATKIPTSMMEFRIRAKSAMTPDSL